MHPTEVLTNLARHQLVDGYPLVVDLEQSKVCWIHDGVTGEKYLDAFTCFASWPLGYAERVALRLHRALNLSLAVLALGLGLHTIYANLPGVLGAA